MRDEIKEYLAWRRKTRFIRRHGGLLPACTIIAATALLLWQRAKARRETTTAMPARKPSPAVVEEVPREAPDDSMSDDPAEAGQTESLLSSNPADQQQTREAMMRWQKAETALKGFFASKSDKERLALR